MELPNEIIDRLEKLGVDDPTVIASYLKSMIEANGTGGDAGMIKEVLEPYATKDADLENLCKDLWELWKPREDVSTEASSIAVKSKIISRWNHEPVVVTPTPDESLKPSRLPSAFSLDREDREATLRLARQIHDKKIDEEIAEEMNLAAAAAAKALEETRSLASQNRAAVQSKLIQAQNARAASVQQHKAESKAAAQTDKKDKADKKEERRRKAQKSERHGGS